MKKIIVLMTGLFLFAAFQTPSHAFVPIHKRRVKQQKRIYQGVRSGELTPRETFRLEREEIRITRAIHHFRRDGHFTPRERVRSQRMLNRTSRHIYRLTHNRRR